MITEKLSHLSTLVCPVCQKNYDADEVQTFAPCHKVPLLATYDFTHVLTRDFIDRDERSMWRYFETLPVFDRSNIVTLGEGWTPILPVTKLAAGIGLENLSVKDESLNPTGSFKARGMSVAISKAKELGVEKCIAPSAGNAGVALSAYAAKAGMKAIVVMPAITPESFIKSSRLFGSEVILVDGLIDACAVRAAELNRDGQYFDFSTMKEPYRLEGKKTLGYEIAEQHNWSLPDVILYPTGGGTGLIGIWKAFREMLELGWITGPLPRMVAVQSELCQPVVRAMDKTKSSVSQTCSASLAYGLNVPKPFALPLIIDVLRESGGEAIAVSEKEIMASTKEIIAQEGMMICPEGGSLWAALKGMVHNGKIQGHEKVLMLNTGSGFNYLNEWH